MTKLSAPSMFFLVFLFFCMGMVCSAERPWVAADLSFRYAAWDLDSPQSLYGYPVLEWANSPERPRLGVLPSADGRYVLWIHYRNELLSDRTKTTLEVLDTQDIREALRRNRGPVRPKATAVFLGNAGGDSGLFSPRWDADGKGVLFLGTTDSGYMQVYRLDVITGAVVQLTDAPHGVDRFEYRAGRALYGIYNGEAKPSQNYPVERLRFEPGVGGFAARGRVAGQQEYFTSTGLKDRTEAIEFFADASISPDGTMAVSYRYDKFQLLKFERDQPLQKTMTVAAATWVVGFKRVIWTGDGREVVLIGAKPPNGDSASSTSGNAAVIGILNPFSGKLQVLHSLRTNEEITSVAWSESAAHLTFSIKQPAGAVESVEYQQRDGQWQRIARTEREPNVDNPLRSLVLEIRQSENVPPVLVASEGAREVVLSPPDQSLAGVKLITSKRFRWRDFDGRWREGGLLLPLNYQTGQPVPVVIQPYYYLPQMFLPDGVARTAFSAQALAARGIAVLTIDSDDLMAGSARLQGVSTPMEGPDFILRLEKVVDAIVEQGIGDPTQIGLVSFSRSGYLSLYAATHPSRSRFAAAVVADSIPNSYPTYLYLSAVNAANVPFILGAAGRSPWEEPEYWLDHDVTLNADRIFTPILFSANGTGVRDDPPVDHFETLGALQINSKPMDTLLFPRAGHQLTRAQERVAMTNAVVDWVSFWMLGEEDPDPAKFEQNRRWRGLRTNWDTKNSKNLSRGEAGFITTRSGLSYLIRNRKSGREPFVGEILTFHYVLRAEDGTQIANTYKKGRPLEARLGATLSPSQLMLTPQRKNRVLQVKGQGLNEALAFMHVGEKATFAMPRDLVPEEDRRSLGSSESARYDVELLSIRSDPAATNKSTVLAELRQIGLPEVGADFKKLNQLGYEAMYLDKNVRLALQYFGWNLVLFPEQVDLYDSLAEGYLVAADCENAIKYYETVLRLNPAVGSSAGDIVARLKRDPEVLPVLREEVIKAYRGGSASMPTSDLQNVTN